WSGAADLHRGRARAGWTAGEQRVRWALTSGPAGPRWRAAAAPPRGTWRTFQGARRADAAPRGAQLPPLLGRPGHLAARRPHLLAGPVVDRLPVDGLGAGRRRGDDRHH